MAKNALSAASPRSASCRRSGVGERPATARKHDPRGPCCASTSVGEMLAILGGLGAALAWTVTTLVASRASRLIDAWSLLATVMTMGLLVSAPLAAIAGVPSGLNRHSFGWLAVSGMANVAGLLLTYAALSVGKVGVVAPVTSTEGAVAAVIAVIAGEQLSGGTVATLIADAAGGAPARAPPAVACRVPHSERWGLAPAPGVPD